MHTGHGEGLIGARTHGRFTERERKKLALSGEGKGMESVRVVLACGGAKGSGRREKDSRDKGAIIYFATARL